MIHASTREAGWFAKGIASSVRIATPEIGEADIRTRIATAAGARFSAIGVTAGDV